MKNYLFDIDGTLTPARLPIDREFRKYFGGWIKKQQKRGDKVFFVTGSDRDKTVEQLGLQLIRVVDGCYQNCGNELYVRSQRAKWSVWKMSEALESRLNEFIEGSEWYGTADINIQVRVGMVNVSTIGRGCTREERAEYYKWDKENKERLNLAETITGEFPDLDVTLGGEISVDIYPKGRDKSQVLKDMKGKTIFFGDRCYPDGNDHAIAMSCDEYYHVADWTQTRDILAVMNKIEEL